LQYEEIVSVSPSTEFSELFQQFDGNKITLRELSFTLRRKLSALLDSEQLAGEQRNIIRSLYSSLDKALDEYLSIDRYKQSDQSVSPDELNEAKVKLTKTVSVCRDSLVDFFKRQINLTSPTKQDGQLTDIPYQDDKNLQDFKAKINQNPNDGNAYNSLGNYYFQVKHDYNEAIKQYKLAIDKNPSNYIYYSNIGDSLSQLKEYKESSDWYKRALERDPRADVTLNSLANIQSLLEEYDEAITNYTRALKINASPIYYVNLGDTYVRKKQYEDALRIYENSLLLDRKKEAHYAYDAIGDWYRNMYFINRQKDSTLLEKAIKYYKQSLAIKPDSERTYAAVGEIYYYQKNYDESIAAYIKAAELNKYEANYYANIGYSFFIKGDMTKTQEYYTKALEADSDRPVILRYIGEFNNGLGKFDEAVDYYNRYLQKVPEDTFALRALSEIYSQPEAKFAKRDLKKSLQYVNTALEIDREDYFSYIEQANVYKEMSDYDNAIRSSTNAIELNDKAPDAYNLLGRVYYEKVNYLEAIKQFEKAISLGPENPINDAWLSEVYLRIHDLDKALQYAEIADRKAKATDPNTDKYVEYIAKVYHYKGLEDYDKGKLDEAIQEFKKANTLKENHITYYSLYLCYFYSDPVRTEEARQAILRAIDLSHGVNPAYTEALNKLA
jgi:tetratricopeptide (TPR) repeat protein